MRQHLSIAILLVLLSVCSYAQAQVEVVYPEEDPVRLQNPDNISARTSSTSGPDTTHIPFFEDFTDPLVPKKAVYNVPGKAVKITTIGLHGLYNGDNIVVFDVSTTEYTTLNGTFFVKVITPFEFKLYTAPSLSDTDSLNGNGNTITVLKWAKTPYDRVSLIIPATPDALKWMPNGGAYINDRYPVEPTSYNVATFDGLNYLGKQYNPSNFSAQGYADNLTSVPIDLSGLTVPDSLYLSFYWQCAGIGEAPETNDYFVVEFKDPMNSWVEVLRIYGDATDARTKHFTRANVKITDAIYLYKGFQFRFRNRGRLSGPFDVWNLDGIYFNKKRHLNDTIVDWAVSRAQHTFLKNYSAMPYEHYFSDQVSQSCITDSISFVNVSGKDNRFNSFVEIYDNIAGVNDYISVSTNLVSIKSFNYREDADFDMDYNALTNTNIPRAINLYYYIQGQIDEDSAFLGSNNYYRTETILWDYYAYDDGTPEYAIKTSASGVSLANKYQLGSTGSTLTAVDYCFTRNAGIDMEDRTIFLNVWGDNAGKPGAILHQQSLQIHYPDPFYGFVRYTLTTPLSLSAGQTYYVGYLQNLTDPVFTGYDASIDHSDKMYSNDGPGGWIQYSSDPASIGGSLMIRPVFDNGQILTPVVDASSDSFNATMYPNPADDLLNIDGDITEVTITDLLGRTVLTYTNNQIGNAHHTLNTTSIAEGLYLVRMTSSNGASKTEKLLVK